jgi:hypothetical protein
MFNWKHGLALAALLGASTFATIPSAKADTFYTTNVTTNTTSEIVVTFTANAGYLFVDSNVADVNLSGNVSNVTETWTGGSSAVTGMDFTANSSQQVDGTGKFTLTTDLLSGPGGNPTVSTITLDITGSSLALVQNSLLNEFAAHICVVSSGSACSNTFFTTPGNVTPIPGALPLFGSVLAGAYLFARKRRRTYKTPVSAFA